ncbi:hypothetical protein BKA00_000745 [Actinomadura coerulea]|uniref:Cell division protein FtsL n=1 Tax=Actinomadura coerulea TaxID=46159 RepID=A0A7X0FUA4_9ACTN|nr:hypothetical protein [Actinomadura coerulea]MBB6393831.1 hypothetical protein [Actinomadura coerulea]GGP89949.1 hypothetical protein GCM10010187_01550 [Actinomadura coerulea]
MTTTSRRPPTKAPKKRAPERPDGAAPARPAPPKSRPSGAAPVTPARAKAAPAKPAAAKTAPAPTRTKVSPAKSTKAAKETKAAKAAVSAPASTKAATASRRGTAPRAPFVLLIVGLLGGALVSLLLLNTVLAKDAFTLTRLQQSNKQLEQQRQAYEEEIAREGAPQQLSKKAEGLGMKQGKDPAFFSTEPGRPGGTIRPVPHSAAASAGAAGVLGVPGTVIPGDGVPLSDARTNGAGTRNGQGAGARNGNGTGARSGTGTRTGHGAP